jgi:hypothetical protein
LNTVFAGIRHEIRALKVVLHPGSSARFLVCFLPIFEYKLLNLMILQQTKLILLLDVVFLPGKRDPSLFFSGPA